MARDIPATLVDARQVIITDGQHGRAIPQVDEINHKLQVHAQPLVADGRVPVMGGFIGSTREGITTTIGRGGSDFSAALVGRRAQCRAHRDLDRRGRHEDHRSANLPGRAPH